MANLLSHGLTEEGDAVTSAFDGPVVMLPGVDGFRVARDGRPR